MLILYSSIKSNSNHTHYSQRGFDNVYTLMDMQWINVEYNYSNYADNKWKIIITSKEWRRQSSTTSFHTNITINNLIYLSKAKAQKS